MFLARPAPFSDESLSSWRQRSGMANGFRIYPRPYSSSYIAEPDQYPKEKELQWLSEMNRLTDRTIRALCLDNVGRRISARFMQAGRRRWVVPCRSKSHTGNGSVCCPMCLATDAVPYIRLQWRFAFMTHCPLHGSPLLENCPRCGGGMWPTSQLVLLERGPSEFSRCQSCGEILVCAIERDGEMQEIAQKLWLCATQGAVPTDLGQATNSQDVFDALWVMSQLLIRSGARKIWSAVPVRLQTDVSLLDGIHTVEMLPAPRRSKVIKAAYWLLSDWPSNFKEATRTAHITRVHFSSNWAIQPAWLSSYINKNLSVKKLGITEEQVRVVITQLEGEGLAVTKSSLRRALQVSEAKAIHALVKHRRHATRSEFTTFCAALEQRVATAPRSRDQKATLSRDYLIFLLSVLSDRCVEAVCKMSPRQVDCMFADLQFRSTIVGTPSEFRTALERANQLAEQEEHLICDRNADSAHRFIGRFGEELAGHTVRERFAKLMKLVLGSELWNSMDAFLGLFH